MRQSNVVNGLKAAAETISELVSRRSRSLLPVSKTIGAAIDGLRPSADWNNLAVASYIERRPNCLYFEPAFTEYHRHLEKTYANDGNLFAADFTSCGHDLWRAIETAERIAGEVEEQEFASLDAYEAVNQYLNPWYLRIVEQAFDALLGLAVHRLLTDEGKQPPSKPRQIYEAIKAQGWFAAGEFYQPIIRNGIAHEVEFMAETVSSPVSIVYTDAGGRSESVFYKDLVNEVTGIVDECLGYAFALRLFLLEHSSDAGVQKILEATPSNLGLRKTGFRSFASSRSMFVQSVQAELVNGKTQIRVECLDRTRNAEERLAEIAALLISGQAWFPDGETFFIGLKSKDPVSFVRVEADSVASWVRGEMADQVFVGSFDPVLLWPKKTRLGRLRSNLARTVPIALETARNEFVQASSELPNRLPRAVRVLSLDDISHGLARRYRGEFLIDADDQAGVRSLLAPLVAWIKRQHVHHSPQSKKRWHRTPPVYVAGFLYSREKRERDRGTIPSSPFYIGRFEWRDPDTNEANLPLPMVEGEDLTEGLTYSAAAAWPSADRFIPR
jgi:hypothetical protein